MFHSFRLIFGRAIISRSALEARMLFRGTRARGTLTLKRRCITLFPPGVARRVVARVLERDLLHRAVRVGHGARQEEHEVEGQQAIREAQALREGHRRHQPVRGMERAAPEVAHGRVDRQLVGRLDGVARDRRLQVDGRVQRLAEDEIRARDGVLRAQLHEAVVRLPGLRRRAPRRLRQRAQRSDVARRVPRDASCRARDEHGALRRELRGARALR